jgi:hypothetical protein
MAIAVFAMLSWSSTLHAQMIDNTQAPNTAKAGINKSLTDEIGAGRGDVLTPTQRKALSDHLQHMHGLKHS